MLDITTRMINRQGARFRTKNVLLDLFLGVISPMLITFLLLRPIVLPNGVPFYGDETYYHFNITSFYSNPFNWLYMWTPAHGLAPPLLTLFSYSVPLTSLASIFGQELAVKIFILVVASLPAILTYFAMIILAKEWALFNKEMSTRMFSLVGALFMLLSFTNSGLIGGATAPAWSYITLPLSSAFLIRYLRDGSVKNLVLLGILSLFAVANPFWIYLVFLSGLIYFIIEVVTNFRKLNLVKRSLIAILVLLALNAYWLAPTIVGYVSGASGTFQVYTKEQLISFEGLQFLSHWNLLDVIMVGEHSYHFFWLHPQNYGLLNVAIPILAAISILIFRKNKHVLFMALILTMGIFLTKGVHEPGGYLYYLIAKGLPYGAGAILRNPTKFVPLVTFSYAFLIGLFVTKVYEKLSSFKLKRTILRSNTFKYGVVAGLALLVLAPITHGTLIDLQGYTWLRYKPVYVPQVYDEINDWLLRQPDDFKVMWIPSGGAYVWKPYIITGFPDLLSSKPAVNFKKIWPELSTDNIGKVLTSLGVKYVIFHGDSLDYPNNEILNELQNRSGLKQVLRLNYLHIPENNSNDPLPTGQRYVDTIPVEFVNVPFEMMEDDKVFLRGEESNITLYYEIPDFILEQGYKGKFWAGFNIRLEIFPAGSVDLYKRVYEAFILKQEMINEKAGYAIFNVKIPYNYVGTAVDVYANIYDGSFRSLSPFYYIGRFEIDPPHISIPFIVFGNVEYKGPIYIADGTAKIISYHYISPVEWRVKVNSSCPFTMILTEPYDRLWKAYVNGTQLDSVPYRQVNSFTVNASGTYEVRLYYTLQDYFLWGAIITIIAFITLCVLYIKNKMRTFVSEHLKKTKPYRNEQKES